MPSFFTPIIDTAIGIVVVYIAFSLLASWLGEQVSSVLQTRSKMLVGGITQLLTAAPGTSASNKRSAAVTNPAAAAFFNHPIFQSLKQDATKDPQYLSAQQFSSIVLGLMIPAGAQPPAPSTTTPAPAAFDFTTMIATAKTFGIDKQVEALASKANGDYRAFVKAIEDWYDDHMDRVSGWYVKQTQVVLICIGLVIAILWNVDTLRVARALSCNAALRTSVAELNTGTKQQPSASIITSVTDAVPLGWDFAHTDDTAIEKALVCDTVAPAPANVKSGPRDATEWFWWTVLKVIGLVITAVALSQGASFWFDALSKLTRVRNAGKKPDTSSDASRA